MTLLANVLKRLSKQQEQHTYTTAAMQVRVELYDVRRTKFVEAHTTSLACLALSLDGKLLATASERGTLVRVFSTTDGSKLQVLALTKHLQRSNADAAAKLSRCAYQPSLARLVTGLSERNQPTKWHSCSTALSYAGWASVWCFDDNLSMQFTVNWGELLLPEIANSYAGNAMQIMSLCSSSRVWVLSSYQIS